MRRGLIAFAAAAAVAPSARAGGFEVPDNGARSVGRGTAQTVSVQDLTAIQYNPGALVRLEGGSAMWHHNVVLHETRFRRATLSEGWLEDAGTTFEEVADRESVFALGGFVAAGLRTGDVAFALGVYGPSSVGRHDFPDYGPQSFMLTETDLLLAYYSVAAAWAPSESAGVGVTLQWADLQKMDYELVVDATPTFGAASLSPLPDPESAQLLTKLRLSDRFAFTAVAGGFWRPAPGLELGASFRLPVRLEPEGGVSVDKPTLVTDALSARLALTLPFLARAGVRVFGLDGGGGELWDLELDLVWEGWSSIDRYVVEMDGKISGQEVDRLVIEKRWRDTWSIRLGGDLALLPRLLTVRAGAFWESGASPETYSHIDFPSFMRLGTGAGLTVDLGTLSLTAAYQHVFQEDREVTEVAAKQFQQRPLRPCPADCGGLPGVMANAGTFETSFDVISLGLDWAF